MRWPAAWRSWNESSPPSAAAERAATSALRAGGQAAHRREHVEDDGEVVPAEAEAARHREIFLRERRGGQGDADGAPLIERELHILLHHRHVEHRLLRHPED